MGRKILGVGGSPREKGNSDALLTSILSGARGKGVVTRRVHLRDYDFQSCIGCEGCRKNGTCTGLNDGMQLLYPKILESRGLALVSPTHNYNVTAWMKAFIDRLYCFYVFDDERPRGWSSRLACQGRKAVIAAVCEQEDRRDMGFTLEAMRLPLEALGFEIVGELAVLGIFDRGMVSKRGETLARASSLGADLAESLADGR
ncbi:MAG: flavodoxin family protein [Deltaproteobacteria bacterium]|nr:flavodoxin family protein [Deltaproteobacteria bacterium]MBW2123605.1 flavodoxin family protein [Deltaproteobacteria bacterium]